MQKLKSSNVINNNNIIKTKRSIDFEKEKNYLDSINKEFLNNEEKINKLNLNSIQINSINLFSNNTKNKENNELDLIDNIDNILNQNNFFTNLKYKSKDFFEMMILFTEFNKIICSDPNQKEELNKISKKISGLLFEKNEVMISNKEKFNKNNSYGGTGNSPYISTSINNTNEKSFDFKFISGPKNSLAKARKEKEILRNSKNTDSNTSSTFEFKNLNTYRNSNPENINNLMQVNNDLNNNNFKNIYNNDLNNYTQNANELSINKKNFNNQKQFIIDDEINLNNYINSNKIFSNKINKNNHFNTSLIEDIPLENPFNNSKKIKAENLLIYGASKKIDIELIENLKNNNRDLSNLKYFYQMNTNKIIKIQKYWRRWKAQKISISPYFSQASVEIKNKLFNSLSENDKLFNLINSLNNALSIYNSLKFSNHKGNK